MCLVVELPGKALVKLGSRNLMKVRKGRTTEADVFEKFRPGGRKR